ncbi:hypothetical protein GGX14DRAFT_399665 [Mycena pura]|uniref:Uncharacterized protein n=1 Tax=Mycena pura TaxID=153505 RepID=A0AAD6V4E5_9AGAR|nr:hypothetical protein GGX14DRAFT_399665 [Mycena pura]
MKPLLTGDSTDNDNGFDDTYNQNDGYELVGAKMAKARKARLKYAASVISVEIHPGGGIAQDALDCFLLKREIGHMHMFFAARHAYAAALADRQFSPRQALSCCAEFYAFRVVRLLAGADDGAAARVHGTEPRLQGWGSMGTRLHSTAPNIKVILAELLFHYILPASGLCARRSRSHSIFLLRRKPTATWRRPESLPPCRVEKCRGWAGSDQALFFAATVINFANSCKVEAYMQWHGFCGPNLTGSPTWVHTKKIPAAQKVAHRGKK